MKAKSFFQINNISLILDSGALALIDANQGFGQIMGEKSVQEGTNRAKNHGIALIGLEKFRSPWQNW